MQSGTTTTLHKTICTITQPSRADLIKYPVSSMNICVWHYPAQSSFQNAFLSDSTWKDYSRLRSLDILFCSSQREGKKAKIQMIDRQCKKESSIENHNEVAFQHIQEELRPLELFGVNLGLCILKTFFLNFQTMIASNFKPLNFYYKIYIKIFYIILFHILKIIHFFLF